MGTLRATVIGGGTGAPVSIKALLSLNLSVSAVVAMADDGGSSGILRERAGAIPPGDIRKCLVAMAADQKAPMTRAFQYRFDYAQNHALGNLILTALADTTSFPQAITLCEELLETRGHVYPSTLDNVVLNGRTRDGRTIRGQANISKSDCALARVFFAPAAPQPYQIALDAIMQSDLIVLGPGSLFTSIIPNLLVPGVADAIKASSAKTVFVCSLADLQGETWGLSCAEHVEALLDHGMRGILDYVFLHSDYPLNSSCGAITQFFAPVTDADTPPVHRNQRILSEIRRLGISDAIVERIRSQGPHVLINDFIDPLHPTWHDPIKLRVAFKEVLTSCHLQRR